MLGGRGYLARLAPLLPVLLILAVAAPLRLADLGWSEFQGDEARVVLRAMAALQGADGALAAHRKVPGEILLTYLFAGSLGQIQEGIARLPFALAGVGAVLAFYSLARKLLGGPAALVAGLLLAVNGYFVAFGRILQYDSLAFFLGISGLLCCWRFGRTAAEDARTPAYAEDGSPIVWAFLGALLLASAALVALGSIFFLPPALLLSWPGLWRHRRSWRMRLAWVWPVGPAALAAWLVLGADDPEAGPSGVMSYLGPRFGGERPYWHWQELLLSADHYLSTPYLGLMLLAGAVAILLGLIGLARAMSGRGVLIRVGAAIMLAALTWDRPRPALALGAGLLFLLILQAPGQRLPMRAALAWAAGPLFVHLFLIRVPGTHWREAFPGLILVLAALLVPVLAHARSRRLVGGLGAVLVLLVGHFSWVAYVQRQPEYQITYPADRDILDWSNQDGRGIGGVFGAVHHHGWKALGVLTADGAFPDGYGTNESVAIAAWYLRRPQGCEGALAYVFRVPRTPQDRNLAGPVPLPVGYQTRGQIRVAGRPTISLQLPPTATARPGEIAADAYEERFDRELASVWRPVGELYRADIGAAAAKRACAPETGRPTIPLK
jgi:4-amino-4-deoxy-L-arabinose transferase-like glycosyltransferase